MRGGRLAGSNVHPGAGPLPSPLLDLEFGAGFNTPGVVRWPLEQLVIRHPNARFVRVNPEHPEAPREIAARSLALPVGAAEVVAALTGSG